MSAPTATTRIVTGRADVARQLRAASGLMADLRAPVTARAPWLTAVLNVGADRGRPVAVTVHRKGDLAAAAFLAVSRHGLRSEITMLGQGAAAVPPGRPASRLPARDPDAAELLADGICGLLGRTRSLRLAGLPLGDPTCRALVARLPDGLIANERSTRLLDHLDTVGPALRSRDARDLDRWLPQLLDRVGRPGHRDLLRAAGRLHAAIGRLEVAVVAGQDRVRAGLLTLVEGDDRWPWWGWSDVGGLGEQMGAPLVCLTAPARRWP